MSAQLVVDPTVGFAALDRALASLGFRRDGGVQPFTAPMIADEPELAAWTRADDGARLTYTFNPVVTLRVLAVPPELAPEVGARLPLVGHDALEAWLADGDARRVLLGLFAARVLCPRDLLPAIERLRGHADALVRRAADGARQALTGGAGAPTVRVLCELAIPTLTALVGRDGAAAVAALQPRPEDYARVFAPEIAAAVGAAYERLWLGRPRIEPMRSGGWSLKVDGATAAMLRDDTELSRRFPGGYRAIAHHLQPEAVWLVWRYVAAGQAAGMRYDGLVRLDDRWIWLPKPYRVVGELLRSDAG